MAKRFKNQSMRPKSSTTNSTGKTLPATKRADALIPDKRFSAKQMNLLLDLINEAKQDLTDAFERIDFAENILRYSKRS